MRLFRTGGFTRDRRAPKTRSTNGPRYSQQSSLACDHAYAASGAWRAEGRASHALCLAGSPMGWPKYSCRILFARAPVLGLCFCVSVILDHSGFVVAVSE